MLDLDELMRKHAAATPGPWSVKIGDFESEDGYGTVTAPYVDADGKTICVPFDRDEYENDENDAAYICSACNAVPELVARIRALEAQLYEAVGCIISNESQTMIDCRICFFLSHCEYGKDNWKPDPEMCRKAIMHCITTEDTEENAGR